MPGRGFASALLLILSALACLAGMRRVERDRRLMAKLRDAGACEPGSSVPLDKLDADDLDCAAALAPEHSDPRLHDVATVALDRHHTRLRKRTRVALAGACVALVLVVLVAILILRR